MGNNNKEGTARYLRRNYCIFVHTGYLVGNKVRLRG